MSAGMIEAEPDTCALLMVLMMLNLPGTGSFATGSPGVARSGVALPVSVSSLTGHPTLATSLAAAGCVLPLLRGKMPLRMAPGEGAAEACMSGWPSHVSANVANFWVLSDKDGPPDPKHVQLCGEVIKAQKAGQGQIEALQALSMSPVAVELSSNLERHRPFLLPAHAKGSGGCETLAQVRETSFGNSGQWNMYVCMYVCVYEICMHVCMYECMYV
jgi:hypothetical protein